MQRGRLYATALFSVLFLFAAIAYQMQDAGDTTAYVRAPEETVTAPVTSAPSTQPRWQEELLRNSLEKSDSVALEGLSDALSQGIAVSYSALQQSGEYTEEKIGEVADNMAETIRIEPVFTPHTAAELTIDTNTSYARMLSYRSDMRIALEPLLSNKESEFEIFARYISSKDSNELKPLEAAARNYRKAIQGAMSVTVPADVQDEHIRAVNALLQFAVVLDDIQKHASDPLASVALMRTYTVAETAVLTTFNDLARYYSTKKNV